MRALLLIPLLFPLMAHAIGYESCHYEGKINGKLIKLEYLNGNAYGKSELKKYSHCVSLHEREDSDYPTSLRCGENKEGRPIISYQLQSKERRDGTWEHFYTCKSGCNASVINRFDLVCEDGS